MSSIALILELENPNSVPSRRYQVLGSLSALALAWDGSRHDASYEIDLRMKPCVGEAFAAMSILLLDESAATVG